MSFDFLEDAGESLDKCGFPYAMVMINDSGFLKLVNCNDTAKEKLMMAKALEKLASELRSEVFR